MDIEIRRGPAEARLLIGAHWRMLLVYAGLGVVFPYLLLGSEPLFSLRNIMAIASDPWTNQVSGSITGPLYLLGIVAVIVAGAMLAAWNGLLVEIREGYIGELMYGMVAGFAYLVANIVLYLLVAFVLVGLPVLAFGLAELNALPAPVTVVRELLAMLLGTWLAARFCLVGPIMGAAGKLEPVSAFAESWRRTRTAQWRLSGFYLLYGVAVGVAVAALILLHGWVIVGNAPGGFVESLMSVGWVLLFGGYFLAQLLIPAGFHRASQPGATAAEVFA